MIEDKVYAARSILVVGAHAFDAEVIAGPLAAVAASRGAAVTFLHLTMGEQGHPCLIPDHYCAQKEEEAAKAAKRLGIGVRNLGLKDAFVRCHPRAETRGRHHPLAWQLAQGSSRSRRADPHRFLLRRPADAETPP